MARPDLMLLTHPASAPLARHEPEYKSPHDFSTYRSLPSASLSTPPPDRPFPPSQPASALLNSINAGSAAAQAQPPIPPPPTSASKMTTPNRGLPPPAPLALSDPGRYSQQPPHHQHPPPGPPSATAPPPLSGLAAGLPAPPSQWRGNEDELRSWLATKAEEERRKQEEERTRQESLKLEQRKIEQNMLVESFRAGVPPNMVPLVFISLGYASAGNQQHVGPLNEIVAQYVAQVTGQPPPRSPEEAREQMIAHGQASFAQAGTSVPATPLGSAYTAGFAAARAGTNSGPPSGQRSHFLPRLATEGATSQPAGQLGQQEHGQGQLLFHHWQPPTSGSEAVVGQGSGGQLVPDTTASPRKRKNTHSHAAAPPPSSLRFSENPTPTSAHHPNPPSSAGHAPPPPTTSSGTSSRRSTGHTRQRSDTSARAPPAPGSAAEQHQQQGQPPQLGRARGRAETIATDGSSSGGGGEGGWFHHAAQQGAPSSQHHGGPGPSPSYPPPAFSRHHSASQTPQQHHFPPNTPGAESSMSAGEPRSGGFGSFGVPGQREREDQKRMILREDVDMER